MPISSFRLVPPQRPIADDPPAAAAPGDAAPDTVLDAAALARLAELDPRGEIQLLDRVMTTFQSSAKRLSAQLDAARAEGDRAAIRLVAHTLKSSSGYIGALHLAECCAVLEAASQVASHEELSAEIDAMTAALEVAMSAVSRRLNAR